jgi:hypothetical protein
LACSGCVSIPPCGPCDVNAQLASPGSPASGVWEWQSLGNSPGWHGIPVYESPGDGTVDRGFRRPWALAPVLPSSWGFFHRSRRGICWSPCDSWRTLKIRRGLGMVGARCAGRPASAVCVRAERKPDETSRLSRSPLGRLSEWEWGIIALEANRPRYTPSPTSTHRRSQKVIPAS